MRPITALRSFINLNAAALAALNAARGSNFGDNLVDSSGRKGDDDTSPSWWDGPEAIGAIHVLEFFYDEGGSGKQLIVSAQVCSRNSVRKLNREWSKELTDFGVEFFHSKDYGKRTKGVFKHLSKSQRKRLLLRLTDLIHKHADFGVSARIDTEVFKNTVPPDCRSRWTSAYTFAIFAALGIAHFRLKSMNRHAEAINTLVACGHKNLQQALDRLSEFGSEESVIPMKTVSKGNMLEFPLLQAADILAYASGAKLTGKSRDIFHALTRQHRGNYRVYAIDCKADLITLLAQGWNKQAAAKIEWGRRTTIEQSEDLPS